MRVEICRPRGQTVVVDLGQALQVFEKYQNYLTLGSTWNKNRLSCWRDLAELDAHTGAFLSVEFCDPEKFRQRVEGTLENYQFRKKHQRTCKINDQLSQQVGLDHNSKFDLQPDRFNDYARNISIRMSVGSYAVNEFAQEFEQLVKRYQAPQPKRGAKITKKQKKSGWARPSAKEIIERYLNKIKP